MSKSFRLDRYVSTVVMDSLLSFVYLVAKAVSICDVRSVDEMPNYFRIGGRSKSKGPRFCCIFWWGVYGVDMTVE